MSAKTFALIRSYQVGAHTVTFSFPSADEGDVTPVAIEWQPPRPACIGHGLLAEFRQRREEALSELSTFLCREIFRVQTEAEAVSPIVSDALH